MRDENIKEDEILDQSSENADMPQEADGDTEVTEDCTASEDQGIQDQESQDQDAECAKGETSQTNEKKGFFGKKKKDPKDTQIEELTDRLKRNMAEFDNFRKRTDKEKAAMYGNGARDVLEKMLPVVDNFERGLASIPEEQKSSPVAEGMEKIYKQLMKTLEDMGVTAIEAQGQPFDPNFHNAVMHVDDDSLGENVIAMEMQKGYMYKDTVLRHSMVQVAN